ncbi:MAG: PEP-CTERM sorting domain-containing protein [Deltaproteobacteria bacterium]|nr:PEP-CTERM sorting domain-containing protein [Deltaproteobacteria bacterium]
MTSRLTRRLAALLALCLGACGGDAGSGALPTSFQTLGTLPGFDGGSDALGISADGRVVVGRAFSLDDVQAFAWTADGGMVGLGSVGGFPFSIAHGVNRDGSLIAGLAFDRAGQDAWAWTADGGMRQLSGTLDLTPCLANDVAADRTLVVGAVGCFTQPQAARWGAAGTIEPLGWLNPDGNLKFSEAKGVSADGAVVVGLSSSPGDPDRPHATRWTTSGAAELPRLAGATSSVAWAVSDNGAYVVGNCNFDYGFEATQWSADGAHSLHTIEQRNPASIAYAVADDGRVAVGSADADGVRHAFVWTARDGMRLLRDVLVAQGLGAQIDGWMLDTAFDVTPDGRRIVGSAYSPRGVLEGFVVVLGGA